MTDTPSRDNRTALEVLLSALEGADRVVVQTRNALPNCHDAHYLPAPDIEQALRALLARRERDAEVIEGVLIGGNHLAIHLPVPCPPYQTPPSEALEEIGSGIQYDVWCCWRAIMKMRDDLAARDGEQKRVSTEIQRTFTKALGRTLKDTTNDQ